MRIVAWNVNRNLEQKICDSDFCAVISDYDVIFLSECWIQPGTSLKCDWLNDEFEYKCFPRLKGKDGGLVLLYRKTLRSDAPCLNIGGTCQDDHHVCSGSYVSGLCSGGANRRCCSVGNDAPCLNIGGTCQDDHQHCSGSFVSGLCSGDTHRRCCSTQSSSGWSDIGYSFLVGEDGAVYEGRGWHHVGAHTQNYNSRGFGVSVMGNFMHRKPNNAALNAIKNLIQCGIDTGYVTSGYSLYGHRDVGTTDCPGDDLYNEIRTWSHYNTQKPQR
ncbi:uncharacterized protein LOC130050429 isoform X8 [Ostrea edulis]|uniref:uncharacterized protein LOC130050429 isoform X8 n=1 Tax=Ostrea edulis TaxID=37623 RepID=UPI0024AE8E90|nr:uncharacterized protein LOC130050429 isoform X8 [Ostrea edulis]